MLPVSIEPAGEATGSLSVDPKSQNVPAEGGSASFNVSGSSNVTWKVTTEDVYVTIIRPSADVTGDNIVEVSLAANEGAARTATVTIASVDENDGISPVSVTINQAGAEDEELESLTVAEFIAKTPGDTYYSLTGVITDIADQTYGNITIADNTGKVYIYGLTATQQNSSNDKSFSTLGLAKGDVVTLATKRDEYNGDVQGGGTKTPAYYISHTEGLYVSQTSASISGNGGSAVILVMGGVTWTATSDNDVFKLSQEVGSVTVTAGVNETDTERVANITVKTDANVPIQSFTVKVTQGVPSVAGEATYLIISEYVEGSSNNKYIEIYNPTSSEVDLSDYSLKLYANGDFSSPNKTDELSGTLAAGATNVYKHRDATIYTGEAAVADCANFNGDDVVVLCYQGTEIDAFGPMDNKKGNNFAKDVTMRRKPSVKVPTMTYDPNEWDTFSIDDVSGLGTHIVD